jgi:hypothetical protein
MSAFDGTNGPTLKVQFWGTGGTFVDVDTADLRSVDLNRGRTRADQRINAGTMTIVLDNRSGNYDPDNLSGDWVAGSFSLLRAGLRARLVATWSGSGYVLFDGYLETPDVDANFDAFTTMVFTDGLASFSKVTIPALNDFYYQGETTATRMGRLLNYASWPSGSSWRSLTGSVTLQATTQGANMMDMVEQCVQAESGAFYVSRSGVATFLNLQHKFSRPTMLLFNDSQASGTVEYYDLKTTAGTLQLVNDATVNRGKLKQKTTRYAPSVTKYGQVRKVAVDAPILVDNVASKLALYLARKDADPKTTVSQLSFTALALDTLYPDFLAIELMDQLTVKRKTVDGRSLTMNLVLEGAHHVITPDNWDVTYYTSPMNPYRVTLP